MKPILQFHRRERAFIEQILPHALADLERRREIHRLAEAILADWTSPQKWLALGEVLRKSGFNDSLDWLRHGEEDAVGEVMRCLFILAMRGDGQDLAEQLQAIGGEPTTIAEAVSDRLMGVLDAMLRRCRDARRAEEREHVEEASRSSGLPVEKWCDAVRLAERGKWLPEAMPFDLLGDCLADAIEGDEVGQEVPVAPIATHSHTSERADGQPERLSNWLRQEIELFDSERCSNREQARIRAIGIWKGYPRIAESIECLRITSGESAQLRGELARLRWAATLFLMEEADLAGMNSAPLAEGHRVCLELYQPIRAHNVRQGLNDPYGVSWFNHPHSIADEWPECLGEARYRLPQAMQEAIRGSEEVFMRLVTRFQIQSNFPSESNPALPAVGQIAVQERPEVPRDRAGWLVLADALGLAGEFVRGEVGCRELLAVRSARMQKDGQEVRIEKPEGGGDSSESKSKKDISARILGMLQQDSDTARWSAKEWAERLGCSKSSVVESKGWRGILNLRSQLRIDSAATDRRAESRGELRRGKRNRVDGIL